MEDTGEGDNRSTRVESMERIESGTKGFIRIFKRSSRFSRSVSRQGRSVL